ncbi:hypothetical protein ACIBEF_31295 [Micromonospora sp. NPDC050795]|uniref:hypothetical protein n=1 Tax=Micromonospora sp. NPDC050795 TaxID=3364282 RepID=UPI00378C48B1
MRGSAGPLDAAGLADLVRRTAVAGDDVRIVMADADRYEPVFAELAGLLGRDVLVGRAAGVTDSLKEVSAHPEVATRGPAEWRVVQPPGMATALPGWYDTSGPVIRPRAGLVTVPLPGGLMLAGRADFVARRATAATLFSGHPGLTTIGAPIRAGGFVLGDYGGGHEVADGCRLAAALAALPLYGTEVRMWITWPSEPGEQERLDRNFRQFAEISGATVWAPELDTTIEVLESCHDLAVVARHGGLAGWTAYVPSGSARPGFTGDADGRLSPAAEPLLTQTAGVAAIGVESVRRRAAGYRYEQVKARPGLFRMDLTVLPDGRWAVPYAGFGPYPLGPRELQRRLCAAGWQGETLMLLAGHPQDGGFRRYGERLTARLRADVWVLPPDADFTVVDGEPCAVDRRGQPVEWERLATGAVESGWRSRNGLLSPAVPASGSPAPAVLAGIEPTPGLVTTLPALRRAGASVRRLSRRVLPTPAEAPTPVEVAAPEVKSVEVAVREPKPAPAPAPAPDATPPDDPPGGPSPVLTTTRNRVRHGLYWLADRPRVNSEPVDLYVICEGDPVRAADEGVRTPHLFAVGLLHPPASGTLRSDESLLRVRVAPGGAVDLSSIDVYVPPSVQLLLDCPGEFYLLPAGLLDRARPLDGWRVNPAGGYAACDPFGGGRSLMLRITGAPHGVQGLPVDVLLWPSSAAETAYVLLPVTWMSPDGAVALLAAKPRPRAGHRLLELRVPRRQAVNVSEAARQLVGLPAVRSAAADLVARRIKLVLPACEHERVEVRQVLAPGRFGWQEVPGEGGGVLSAYLSGDRR